jgi:hypothetical protein
VEYLGHLRQNELEHKKPVPVEAILKWRNWASYIETEKFYVEPSSYGIIVPVAVGTVPNDGELHIGFNRYDRRTRTLITL